MELFAVWTEVGNQDTADRFYRLIKDRTKGLHISKQGFRFSYRQHEGKAAWICKGYENHPGFIEGLPRMYEIMAAGLADYVIECREEQQLQRLISRECINMEPEELDRVKRICAPLLKSISEAEQGTREQRHAKLTRGLLNALQDISVINLEGALSFRLHEYKNELHEIVEYALDEFYMDRQYEEFMSLLKYFVYFQDPKIPLVNVIHKGQHEFVLLDEAFNPMPMPQEESVIMEMPGIELEMEVEDMIISRLISISPRKMRLHTNSPEFPLIHTITQIFEDKVEICRSCTHCRSFTDSGPLSLDEEETLEL
ncbi:putative sporulation protein YtxC [Neobacillus mesonae]|nr:putative sporulation protein YtxC [Neobacillus mesonae]